MIGCRRVAGITKIENGFTEQTLLAVFIVLLEEDFGSLHFDLQLSSWVLSSSPLGSGGRP